MKRELVERIKESYKEISGNITSLSMGTYEFQCEDDPSDVVKRADKKMYKNKKSKKP